MRIDCEERGAASPGVGDMGGMDLDLNSEVHSKFPDDMTLASEGGVEMVGRQA